MLSRWRQCKEKKIENINLAADEKISIPLPAEKTVEPAPSYQRPVTPEKEVVVNKSESDIEKKLENLSNILEKSSVKMEQGRQKCL